jgi:hypothetical protein
LLRVLLIRYIADRIDRSRQIDRLGRGTTMSRLPLDIVFRVDRRISLRLVFLPIRERREIRGLRLSLGVSLMSAFRGWFRLFRDGRRNSHWRGSGGLLTTMFGQMRRDLYTGDNMLRRRILRRKVLYRVLVIKVRIAYRSIE